MLYLFFRYEALVALHIFEKYLYDININFISNLNILENNARSSEGSSFFTSNKTACSISLFNSQSCKDHI